MATRTTFPNATQTARPRSRSKGPLGGFSLGRVAGVQIQVNWSLSVIFLLILVNLGAGLFPRLHPEWGASLRWMTALAAALLFFASILAHELSHALVARRKNIPVPRITLFLFGGLAHLESDVPSPRAEFLMAIVGPLMSVLIGVVATWSGIALAGSPFTTALESDSPDAVATAFRAAGPLPTLLLWLGPINILLAIFNMIPGFPLDGGRVLRSFLWWATGDLTKATRWASGAGQAVGFGMMAFGIVSVLSGTLGQGLWLLVLGWFLNNAARISFREVLLRNALRDVPVARLMRTHIDRLTPGLSLEAFMREHVMSSDQHAFPVEQDEALLGMISAEQVRKIAASEWPRITVNEVMTPVDSLPTLQPDTDAREALAALDQRDADLPVIEGDHLLGLIRRGDFLKWLRIRSPSVTA